MTTKTVGQISYTNTKPFFFGWDQTAFPIISGSPRELATLAKNKKIIAGAVPLVECWKLEDQFKPLNNWGIAVQKASNSVFLLSKEPIAELNNVTVGVTTESYTSVALLELLIRKRYGHHVMMKRGFGEDDAAWLVIGDQALQYWGQASLGRWSVITDLATEWWNWTQLPCVFARWIIRKDIDASTEAELISLLKSSLESGMKSIDTIATHHAKYLKIPADRIAQYLRGFTYQFGPREERAETQLREWLYDPIQLN